LVSFALPKILSATPPEFFEGLKEKLRVSSIHAFEELKNIRGIMPVQSKAAMYMMVGIKIEEFEDIKDDIEFAKKFLHE
jgi:hypothetical protein